MENDQDEDKLHLRRQISALQSRLESSEIKNQQLEAQKQEMEHDAELAKNRVNPLLYNFQQLLDDTMISITTAQLGLI